MFYHFNNVIYNYTNYTKTLQIQKAKVTASARFKEDLDLDSLDAVEVVMAIEEEFGLEIPDSEADKVSTSSSNFHIII